MTKRADEIERRCYAPFRAAWDWGLIVEHPHTWPRALRYAFVCTLPASLVPWLAALVLVFALYALMLLWGFLRATVWLIWAGESS